MSQDFKKDYDLYRREKAPQLWGRIEMGLEEKMPKGDQKKEQKEQKGGAKRVARWMLPLAAGLVLVVAGGRILSLQTDRGALTRQESSISQAPPAVQKEKEEALKTGEAKEDAQIQGMESSEASGLAIEASREDGGEEEESVTAAQADALPEQELWEEEADSFVMAEPEMMEEAESPAFAPEVMVADGYLPNEEVLMEGREMFTSSESMAATYLSPKSLSLNQAINGTYYPGINSESYAPISESEFTLTSTQPLSTFAADVDTASYTNVRRMIENGSGMEEIYPDSVRVEEFLNYFSYDIPAPSQGEVFGSTFQVLPCPWNENHQLLFAGVKTEDIDLSQAPSENLTFLMDVSGSMNDSNKLPLVKRAFLALLEELDAEDTISLVTYADGVEVLLESVPGDQKEKIREVIEDLTAQGGTFGEGGIQKAYELAMKNFKEESNNRILLATDGDLNIGISEPEELKSFIKEKRDKGIFLSVLGFGMGNIRDDNMEALADAGNGSYHYIDSFLEAKKVLLEEMGSSLHIVAKDVKFQLEFNPAVVNAYRQLGYENRQMAATDFRNDQKDGGEVGAGEEVIVLYELIPASSPEAVTLTYSGQAVGDSTDYATLRLRYKLPQEDTATEVAYPITQEAFQQEASEDARFAAAVAELALILRSDSQIGEGATLSHVKESLDAMSLTDEYREEFSFLVRLLLKRAS